MTDKNQKQINTTHQYNLTYTTDNPIQLKGATFSTNSPINPNYKSQQIKFNINLCQRRSPILIHMIIIQNRTDYIRNTSIFITVVYSIESKLKNQSIYQLSTKRIHKIGKINNRRQQMLKHSRRSYSKDFKRRNEIGVREKEST